MLTWQYFPDVNLGMDERRVINVVCVMRDRSAIFSKCIYVTIAQNQLWNIHHKVDG